jgi:hypothetical protein
MKTKQKITNMLLCTALLIGSTSTIASAKNVEDTPKLEEQIIVANRISTQGYQTKNEFLTLKDRQNNKPFFRPAVGFGGWGCKKNVGNPILFKKFPAKTLFRTYRLGERGKHIYGIQKIIGTGVDGYFGPVTDKHYNKFFTKYRHIIVAEYNKYK